VTSPHWTRDNFKPYHFSLQAIVAVSIAWIPIIQKISELFHYIQGITSFLSPPVCAVYVLAISWKRINEHVSNSWITVLSRVHTIRDAINHFLNRIVHLQIYFSSGCQRAPAGASGCQRVPAGASGCQRVPAGASGCQRVPSAKNPRSLIQLPVWMPLCDFSHHSVHTLVGVFGATLHVYRYIFVFITVPAGCVLGPDGRLGSWYNQIHMGV